MSRRLGRPKQLLDLNGEPLVRHVAERCLASALDRVWVVVGHEHKAVAAALAGLAVEVVVNDDYATGQSTSLAIGVETAGQGADAVVVLLGDQPGVEPRVIDDVMEARRMRAASIVMAEYGAERSHPILFGRELFQDVIEVTGDQGAREVIRRHRADVVAVPASSTAPPLDVDTEEGYARLLAWYAQERRDS